MSASNETGDPPRRVVPGVTLALVNAVSLLGFGATRWTFGGTSDGLRCDVYCGPVPNMFVALALALVAFALWLLAVVFDVLVLTTGRPYRSWGVVGAAVQLLPVAALVTIALAHL